MNDFPRLGPQDGADFGHRWILRLGASSGCGTMGSSAPGCPPKIDFACERSRFVSCGWGLTGARRSLGATRDCSRGLAAAWIVFISIDGQECFAQANVIG